MDAEATQHWVDIVNPAAPPLPGWWWWLGLGLALLSLLLLWWWLRRSRLGWWLAARYQLARVRRQRMDLHQAVAWMERSLRQRPLAAQPRAQLLALRYSARPADLAQLQGLVRDCLRGWGG